jgi:DNA-binding LytR/AlgR family response regulator
MKIKCLIVDDEELARQLLELFAGKMSQLEVVGSCKDPLEAMQILQQEPVDLIFLDIQMPELTGIQFLRSLPKPPAVILTTAYPEYALEGYELNVVDYLLKPFSFERFVQAVNKALDRIGRPNFPNAETSEEKDYLLVPSEHKVFRIPYADILYIQSMREYVAFYTEEGRVLSLNSLKKLEVELPALRFVRVHKSYIVAIDKVRTLEGNLLHVGKEKIPIGASYREEVLRRVF